MQRFTVYFCKTLYMFQTGFPSIIGSSKLHIQRQVFVRPILAPAASLAVRYLSDQYWHVLLACPSGICQTNTATSCQPGRLAAGSSNGLTNT